MYAPVLLGSTTFFLVDVPYIMWNWLFDNSIKVINVNYTYFYQFD